MQPVSIYIHIPFCQFRCSYCDFFTCAGQECTIPAYASALCREIELLARAAPQRLPAHTVYFGGGTPSLLSGELLGSILETLAGSFDLAADAEISLEANPGTLTAARLKAMRRAGINRLSLGVQSTSQSLLRLLGRRHDFFDVIAAVKLARLAGFDNLNLDLIYGVPGQTMAMWQAALEDALRLAPQHLSLYSLTVEAGTPLHTWVGRGLVPAADDDLAAEQYEWACERLNGAGFHGYEISNWARRGDDGEILACRHNLQYWYNLPYVGLGAGAHGYLNGYRLANVPNIEQFVKRCAGAQKLQFPLGPANHTAIRIDRFTEMQETMMVGLRLTRAGIDRKEFKARFGQDVQDVFGKELAMLITQGLLEWAGDRLRLTQRGRLVSNRVFMCFVGERRRSRNNLL